MTSAPERPAASAEDRLSQLIDRLLASMDAAASTGAWDRVVELADDVLAADTGRTGAPPPCWSGRRSALPPRGPTRLRDPGLRRHRAVDRHGRSGRAGGHSGRLRPVPAGGVGDHRGARGPRGSSSRATASWRASATPPRTRTTPGGPCWPGCGSSSGMAHAAVELQRRHGIEPAIRVGVHSGTVVIAGLASGVIDGSALAGSVPNVAARLEGEAEPGTVVISETTRHLVEPHFELKPVGTRTLKGIARPMELYHVVRSNLAVTAGPRTARVGGPGRPRGTEPSPPL